MTKTTIRALFAAGIAAMPLVMCSPAYGQEVSDVKGKVATVLAALPTSSTKESRANSAELLAMGPAAVAEIASQLAAPGKGNDTQARFAINSMAFEAGRPGAQAQRKMFANALAEALGKTQDPDVKWFLIEQLQFVILPENVPALIPYLQEPKLVGYTVRALVNAGTKEAADALEKAISQAPAENKEALVLGLVQMKKVASVQQLMNIAQSEKGIIKMHALKGLAELGAEPALDMIRQELNASKSTLVKGKLTALELQLAAKMAEKNDGGREKAAAVAREMYKTRTQKGEENAQCSALATLVQILGSAAMPDLITAMDSDSLEVRAAAVKAAARIKGGEITRQLIQKGENAEMTVKVEIVRELGKRGDKAALEFVKKMIVAPESEVREAALWADYNLAGRKAVADVVSALQTPSSEADTTAVKQLLMTAADERGLDTLAKGLSKVGPAGRVAFIEVLSDRGATQHRAAIMTAISDQERQVKMAALKAIDTLGADEDIAALTKIIFETNNAAERNAAQKAVVAILSRSKNAEPLVQNMVQTYSTASPDVKRLVLDTLGRTGIKSAFDLISKETQSADAEIKTAAIRALGRWPDISAADELARIAKEEKEESNRILGLRGFIRIASDVKMEDARKLEMLNQASTMKPGAEEKRSIIGAVGEMKTTDALVLVYPSLTDKDVADDAALAAVKIVRPLKRETVIMPGLALAALELAYPNIKDEEQKKQTRSLIERFALELAQTPVALDSEGFATLFNGKDLAGWIGALNGYRAENGAIICDSSVHGGGNLFTERQYTDFVFRFKFKLEAGANNGLGVRAPLGGDAAFQGMELQILDDTSEKYKDLKDYQFHGSVYGVVPAKKGSLKPVGEWNEQEVTLDGRHVKVVLNGNVIVDADLPQEGIDDRPHPGLKRVGGHIGFLGHGSRVEFKDVKVKELINTPPQGFTALFNGKDLEGWKGLVENPIKRAAMKPDQLAEKQKKADEDMRAHWEVANGTLVFDGKGSHLCTTKDYKDFEMFVDWKIDPLGDSGIYLRGSPQVQIWDTAQWPEGSGGLYNNQKNTSTPLAVADQPIGDWNRFQIKMVGDKVTVHLNGVKVVDNVTLENYWDRKQEIFPIEQIELQSHGSVALFRNIYLRELTGDQQTPAEPAKQDEPTTTATETTGTQQ